MGLAEETNCEFIADKTTWVDRRGRKRERPMRLLCFGLGRTGTASLRLALWELGYNPWHGFSVFENPPDAKLCQEAMLAKFEGKGKKYGKEEFDALFGEFDAILDQPSTCFVEELTQAYPDAKVMVTVRDTDDWYRSIRQTVIGPASAPSIPGRLVMILDPTLRLIFGELFTCNKYTYGDKWWLRTREEAQKVWDDNLKLVNDTVGEDKVLKFDVREGWGPLCSFLGHDVPRDADGNVRPFPRVNDTAAFGSVIGGWIQQRFLLRMAQAGAIVAVVAATGVAAYRYRR